MAIDWTLWIIPVYFLYGLAFYSMGFALLVESGRASELGFARSMRLLSGFGLLHGIHEWLDMFENAMRVVQEGSFALWLQWFRVAILAASFLALMTFGEHLRSLESETAMRTWLIGLAAFWYAGSCIAIQVIYQLDDATWVQVCDVLTRYVLGIPASIVAALALYRQRKNITSALMRPFTMNFSIAAAAMLLYGVIGQIFVKAAPIFPSNVVNEALFIEILGFPVQALRAVIAIVLAISMIGALRVLEVENQERLKAVEESRRESELRSREELSRLNASLQASEAEARQLLLELRKRESLRTEFLQQVTAAQESERRRIARELHDGTGQMLTGLGLGLRGMSVMVHNKPEVVSKRLSELENMATTAIGELRSLIQDLRPPQLDDMGLVPAIRSMLDRFRDTSETSFELKVSGEPFPLPSEIETLLFRVVQEGITNITKHAHAEHACVDLAYDGGVDICISDDGIGCDPNVVFDTTSTRTAWGLIGIAERAKLINADWAFESEPGNGTKIMIHVPVPEETET
jgi:signal transduction histidine kinase